ncbi:unnamed protein product [Brassica rapa subsp. narinosa]
MYTYLRKRVTMLKTLLVHGPLLFFFFFLISSVVAGDENDGGLSICNCDDEDSYFSYEGILESQKVGDFLIAVAYFSIPIELLYFVSRTNVSSPYIWVVCEFIAFIVLCGMSHLLSGFTYGPHYPWVMTAATVFKMLTAIVSFLTAISLVTLLPLLLKAKVREFMLSKKTRELNREVGLIMKQTETSLHVRMLTTKIRTSLDRHTILYTTLVELSKTLGLKNCAVWIPNEIKTEMNLTHELNGENVGRGPGGGPSGGPGGFSIPITESDVVRIKRSVEVNMLSAGSALASVTTRGKTGQTVGIRVPMLRVCNFKGGTPEAIHMCYAILVCVLPLRRSWSYQELEIVKVVADQVAVAISHAVILEESQLMREKLAEQNRALQVARENAMRANQAKAAFEEMMGDAMRRPVRSILELLPLITQDGVSLPETQKVIVDAMGRTSELLLHLVNNAGDVASGTHCFSLRSVVKETACLARCLCLGNGFGFTTDVDRALPDCVVGDARKVLQVVLHMLGGVMNRKIKGNVSFKVVPERGSSEVVKESQEAAWRQCYSKEYVEVKFGFDVAAEGEESSSSSSTKFMQGNVLVVEDGLGLVKSLSVVFRFQLRRSIVSRGGGYSGETFKTSTPPSTSNGHWRHLKEALKKNLYWGMTETVNEDSGVGRSVEASSNGHHSLSGESLSLSKWRSSAQVENGTPSTSLSYWDTDDDEDHGLKPSQLFGKHKWKIEKFSEIKKRELRSNYFEAGGYKWYILIYPQGCDVCNHLSLFLCVANHDKLLPGWSHFAQFTIAVVNKDPKKSKFSDTLHRFWKKEHDWGWKKFMESTKLQDGFIDDSDSLTIEAQVQVIRERVDRPFRCLHCGYRRELVRVYLSNVEQSCRRFVEEKRSKLGRLIEDKAKWTSFGVFWLGMDQNSRHRMSREKMDVILKGIVKHFFIEKEVTSTLVMDSLYSGLKALEGQSKSKKARPRSLDAKECPAPIVSVDKDMFVLVDDVLLLLERAALEPLPPKENKAPQNRTKDGNDGEEVSNEAVERDERHLTELGRRAVEIFVLTHIFNSKIEVAYKEAIALKRQEDLIREEEEEWLAETEQRAKRGAAEREKKSKKKQAKQKRNKNKGKDKKKEEKVTLATHGKDLEENHHDEEENDSVTEKAQPSAEKTDTLEEVSDISDSVDGSADILHPDLEDGDSSSVHWDADALEIHPPPSEGSSISISTPNGIAERKTQSTMDDSSSTCSNDSIRSGVTNGSYKGNMLNFRNQKSPNQGKNQQVKITSDTRSLVTEPDDDQPKSQNSSSESDWVVVSHIQELESSRNRRPVEKQRNVAQVVVNSVHMDRPEKKSAAVLSSPRTAAKNPSSLTQTKLEKRSVSNADAVPNKKVMSATGPPSSSQVSPASSDSQSQAGGLKADMQKISAPKQPATTTIVTRPFSAPIIPAMRPAPVIVSSSVQPTTSLPRSVSSAGRLGPDSSLRNQQSYTPQSYKHAIVGNSPGSSSSFNHHPSSHGVVPTTLPSASYTQTPAYQSSSFPFGQDGSFRSRSFNSVNMGMNNRYTPAVASNTSLNHIDIETARQQAQSLMTDEFPHLDIINDLLEDENCSNTVFNGSIFNSQSQLFNSQYSYHGGGSADLGISGELLSSGRSRSFGDEGFHYMARGPYAEGLIPTQWQMANMDLSLLAMRNSNVEDTASYHHTYNFGLDSTNQSFSSGINGYTEFRPSNGH